MNANQAPSPMFSIVMPLYNHARYVEQALASVVAQTRTDWELLVVDDGSTDGSGQIADRFASRDRRITVTHQANAGPAMARHVAHGLAAGHWIAYLDSDDIWFPEALAHYAAYISAHPEVSFLFGYAHRLNDDSTITEHTGESLGQPASTADLFDRMFLPCLSVCHRRELLDRGGGLDCRLRNAEDYDLYLRMSLHVQLEPIGQPTGLRRRHTTNLSDRTGYSRFMQAEVLRRFAEQYGRQAGLDPRRIGRRLSRIYGSAARQYFEEKRYRSARGAAAMARQYQWNLRSTYVAMLATCLGRWGRQDDGPLPTLGQTST
jgi:glycosyltransferase involved in cell wall biosynthesis